MSIEQIKLDDLSENRWLELRHPNIGSSEAPILCGEGYSGQTLWHLWNHKRKPFVPGEGVTSDRMWIGKEIQGLIGKLVERKTGWEVHPANVLAIDTARRTCSTIDFRVLDPNRGMCAIETKNRDHISFSQRYTDENACIYDRIQLAHQMSHDPNMKYGYVAVLVGGSELKMYEYPRESLAPIMEDVDRRVAAFWADVKAAKEPPLMPTDIPAYVAEHFGEDDAAGEEPADLTEIDAEVDTFLHATEQMNAFKKQREKARATIMQAMNGAKIGYSSGHMVKLNLVQVREKVTKAHTQVRMTAKEVE